jgi:molybdopterin converting factor subunit 1
MEPSRRWSGQDWRNSRRNRIEDAFADGGRYSEHVLVKVLFFGVLRDWFGVTDEVAELPTGATVGELLELLRGRASKSLMGMTEVGAQEQLWRSLAVAVNREYGSTSIVLRDGDEVALLPPVSGGSCREREQV